jgi:hypothetical protein
VRWRRRRAAWKAEARQTDTLFAWRFLAHVDPPPADPAKQETVGRIYYLGPNHYPAGLYLPNGYNIEVRPGDDEGWSILRVRDSQSKQVLTMWAVEAGDGEFSGAVRQLDGES